MTILARLRSLAEAFKGVELLRSKGLPPQLLKDGDHLVLGVEDEFVPHAKHALSNDGVFSRKLTGESRLGGYFLSFEYQNT
jgi:hypothetical protein